MTKHWYPLLALFFLGIIGGVLYEAGDVLIRLWSRDMGLGVKHMDVLNTMEMVQPLKFLWAPLFSIPLIFRQWSHRRAWLMASMLVGLLAIFGLWGSPFFGAWFLICLFVMTLARASYDALVIASQMDAVSTSLWGFSENSCVMGYRLGIMLVGYVALRASDGGMSWHHIYLFIALILGLSILFVSYGSLFEFLNKVHTGKKETLRQSMAQWMALPGSLWVLIFLWIYRLQDGWIDPHRDYFLLDSGISKMQLAGLKPLALCGTIAGGLGAGICIRYKGYYRTLMTGLMIHGFSGFILYWNTANHLPHFFLKMAFILEQTTKGWSSIAIFSFQLLCCHGENTLSQIALFSALSDLGIKMMSVRAGWIAQEYGWSVLMGSASMCGIPALFLLPYIFSKTFIAQKIESTMVKKS